MQMQGGRGGSRGSGSRGDAGRRQQTRPRDTGRRRRWRRRRRRRWRIFDHLHAVRVLILVNDLLVVGIHDRFLPVVIDQIDHLVLADTECRVARGSGLGAGRHAVIRVIRGRGALLHVVRIALDVLLLLLLVMMMMVMVMVTMMMMMILGMERVHGRRLVQI